MAGITCSLVVTTEEMSRPTTAEEKAVPKTHTPSSNQPGWMREPPPGPSLPIRTTPTSSADCSALTSSSTVTLDSRYICWESPTARSRRKMGRSATSSLMLAETPMKAAPMTMMVSRVEASPG